jgi:hypothetical protein
MSPLGQRRSSSKVRLTAAYLPTTDSWRTFGHFSDVPKPVVNRCSKRTANGLFDHLIGCDEEASRYSQTKGFCRFEIEDGFVFRGGLYREVVWLGTA